MEKTEDIVIVGAGPIGIETAALLKRRGLHARHIDAGPIAATLDWWAPGTKFFSSPERLEIAGVPLVTRDQEKATREEYMAYLRAVATQYKLPIETYTKLIDAERIDAHSAPSPESSRFRLTLRREPSGPASPNSSPQPTETVLAKNLILATGNMDLPRLIGVPGETTTPWVSHYLQDPHHYYSKTVLIVGGKNSAVEAAIRLYRVGAKVAVSYRRDRFDPERIKYWLLPELEWLIDKGRIVFHPETVPDNFEPGATTLRRLNPDAIKEHGSERFKTASDFVLLLTGYDQDKTLFKKLGVELIGEEQHPAFDRETMQTNIQGLFVAGTATGGSQKRAKVFIETSHVHAQRIAATLAGDKTNTPDPEYGRLEEA